MPRAIRHVKGAILKTLTENRKLTWLEIKKKAQLSKGALSKHLNELINEGVVKTSTVNARPPTTTYSLAEPVQPEMLRHLEDFERLALQGANSAFQTGYKIKRLEDREDAGKVLKGYLSSNMSWIMSLVLEYMHLAAASTRGFEERVSEEVRAVVMRERKYEAYLAEMRRQLRSSIEPWIEAVATTVFINGNVAYGADGAVAEATEELMDQIDVDWIKELENSFQS